MAIIIHSPISTDFHRFARFHQWAPQQAVSAMFVIRCSRSHLRSLLQQRTFLQHPIRKETSNHVGSMGHTSYRAALYSSLKEKSSDGENKAAETWKLGIKLQFLVSWSQQQDIPANLTTRQVCEDLVKPATETMLL